MKCSLISVIAGLAAMASAQFQGLPQCAQGCLTSGLPSNCNNLDIGCICGQRSWVDNLSCCIAKSCNPSDQAKTISFAQQICKTANVDLGSTSAVCSATASATPGPSGSTKASTAAATTTTSVAPSSTVSYGGAASTGGAMLYLGAGAGAGAVAAGIAALGML